MPFREMQALANVLLEPFVPDSHQFLQKISDPPFLSVFSAALGLDWRSSGHTQHALELIKNADCGVSIINGKIKNAPTKKKTHTNTPILKALRMTEKVDTCAIQEGPGQLALHYIVFDEHGHWVVIAQKLTGQDARRYHWALEKKSFVESPHAGIIGERSQTVLDLTAPTSSQARRTMTDLAHEPVNRLNKQLKNLKVGQRSFFNAHFPTMPLPKRFFPDYMATVRETKPKNFEELLSLAGIGPATIRGLAAISTQFYGATPCFDDPRTHDWNCSALRAGNVSREHYVTLFLDAAKHARVGRRQKFELIERLSPLPEKSL